MKDVNVAAADGATNAAAAAATDISVKAAFAATSASSAAVFSASGVEEAFGRKKVENPASFEIGEEEGEPEGDCSFDDFEVVVTLGFGDGSLFVVEVHESEESLEGGVDESVGVMAADPDGGVEGAPEGGLEEELEGGLARMAEGEVEEEESKWN